MPMHNWAKVEENIFDDFRSVWIYHLRHTLNGGILPADYFASIEDSRGAYTASNLLVSPSKKPKRLSIRTADDEKIVAVVEVVSRGNKKGEDAFDKFLAQCQILLESQIHLLVVDLHPPTKRDPHGIHGALWRRMRGGKYKWPADKPLTAVSYSVDGDLNCFVEPLAAGDPLPGMPLFLEPDSYINVPLESSYRAAFAEIPAHRRAHVESATAA